MYTNPIQLIFFQLCAALQPTIYNSSAFDFLLHEALQKLPYGWLDAPQPLRLITDFAYFA